MFNYEEFAGRLQDLRKKRNMTQGELADRLGVTGQAVSKWENNQSFPDITLVPALATILDVDINYLFGHNKSGFKKDVSFPETFENLPLVHHYENTACYSLKTVDTVDNSGIKFKDGSTAELSNRLVINSGPGEIKLLSADNIVGDVDLSVTSKHYVFDGIRSLDIEVMSNICEVVRSADNKCRVYATGETRFINMLNVAVSEEKLIIRFDNKNGQNQDFRQENNIKVAFPADEGQNITVKINGSGKLSSEITRFEKGKLLINGSGIIKTQNFRMLDSSINGSGVIGVINAEKACFSINGSGNIKWDSACDLEASINGSGSIKGRNATSANVNINGSGDVNLHNINPGGEVVLRIAGAGNMLFAGGSCKKFDVIIRGNGVIDASGVTAGKASVIIESNGKVTLGRVIESSVEQIKKKGTIKILNRGKAMI